jgi:NADPH:quinone reductase-like Zn-dependent oxidoreductase
VRKLIIRPQADNTTTDIKDGAGPISSLFMSDSIPKPKPSASQALVRIHCFGLNRMDLMQREGKYNVPPQAGKILGVEFSGVIEELGDGDVADFHVGDEVFGLAYGGKIIGRYSWVIASDTQSR